ncbi:MAG: hypothetical protein KF795_06250 [Labilithrix sp.]|nr:hypothetical protein [Labilithrix sp.]
MAPDDAARDTADAIRALHPLACRAAAATNAWATCHDEAKGYDRVLACAKQQRDKARAAVARLPGAQPSSVCGRTVAAASREMVLAVGQLFDRLVPWLEKNRARITVPLATAPVAEVCAEIDCPDLPTEFAIENASYARVSGIECTKTLFRCGVARDNICWINRVASRLGVACDPSENKPSDSLSVRETGRHVN